MARRPPSREERDAHLDELKQAVQTWGDKEKARLENEVKFMRAVLQGRAASEQAGTQNLLKLQNLLELEISDFLSFADSENS